MTEALTPGVVGSSWMAYAFINLVLSGGAVWITGHAIAVSWKPLWHVLGYALLLSFATRFVLFALFEAELLSGIGLLVTLALLAAMGVLSFRLNRARKMVLQYPWLYVRSGLLGWRSRHPAGERVT